MKKAKIALLIVLAAILLSQLACDDDFLTDAQGAIDDIPRLGDGAGIGEKIEKTVCESTGKTWSNRTNTCK